MLFEPVLILVFAGSRQSSLQLKEGRVVDVSRRRDRDLLSPVGSDGGEV